MASHKRPGARLTGMTVAASAAALAPGVGHAVVAMPHAGFAARPGVDQVRGRVAELYREAEVATQQYDAAVERRDALRHSIAVAGTEAAQEQASFDRTKQRLGELAAAQYRSGGFDQTVELMLSSHPDDYLQRAAILDQIAASQAAALAQMRDAQRRMDQQKREADYDLAAMEHTTEELASAQQAAQERLNEAQALLNSLAAPERQTVLDDPGDGNASADGAETMPAVLGDATAATDRELRAVRAAYAELGKPYVFGAAGPSAFDCSGLTQEVWRNAGVDLPRTSQEQASAGTTVPLSQIRPGDLVIYYRSHSHVGVYVGNGQIIHAPHPGARVTRSAVDSMPIYGVVRPS